jgi:hypothetical protein
VGADAVGSLVDLREEGEKTGQGGGRGRGGRRRRREHKSGVNTERAENFRSERKIGKAELRKLDVPQ